jgi:hypothetical protein
MFQELCSSTREESVALQICGVVREEVMRREELIDFLFLSPDLFMWGVFFLCLALTRMSSRVRERLAWPK